MSKKSKVNTIKLTFKEKVIQFVLKILQKILTKLK